MEPTHKTGRYRFRVGLRTLLVGVAIISVFVAWVALERSSRVKEKDTISRLVQKMTPEPVPAFFTIEFHGKWDDERSVTEKWFDSWFGRRAQTIFWKSSKIKDLSPLADLQHLETVFLTNSQIVDIEPLCSNRNIRALFLERTNIEDVEPISKMTNLTHLWLVGTNVKELDCLKHLSNLKQLNLYGVNVTSDEVDLVAKALPNCSVLHDSRPRPDLHRK